MGDAGDWCTVSRLSYALEAATNAARGDGALLAEMLALPAPDTSALARMGKDGDAGPQSEGVASSGLAWAVAVGTMHEGDSQALRTALASIALRSAVRTVLVLLNEALPQSALDQALTPELRRCLDLKVLPVDPLACTNADEAHTQRYHGTYMRFHLFGMVRRRADRWELRAVRAVCADMGRPCALRSNIAASYTWTWTCWSAAVQWTPSSPSRCLREKSWPPRASATATATEGDSARAAMRCSTTTVRRVCQALAASDSR